MQTFNVSLVYPQNTSVIPGDAMPGTGSVRLKFKFQTCLSGGMSKREVLQLVFKQRFSPDGVKTNI